MRRRIAIGAAAMLAVALAAVVLAGPVGGAVGVATAVAQAQGGPRPGAGMGPVGAGMRATMQAVADRLGTTPRDLRQELRGGRSLAEVAAARGVDQAALLQTIDTAARTQLDQAVAAGTLTRGQADALGNVVQQFGPQIITRSGPARGPLGFGPDRGPRGADGERGPRAGAAPGGPGFRGGDRGEMLQPVATLLGLTPQQIVQERQQGRSLAEIAAARGVDQATLVRTIAEAMKQRLDQAVASGRLPQDRADAMLQRAQQEIPRLVTRTEAPAGQLRPQGQRDGQRDGGPRDGRGPRGPLGGAPAVEAPTE